MPSIDESLFLNAVNLAVARNLEFVPPHAPYGASGSMYIRPMMVSIVLTCSGLVNFDNLSLQIFFHKCTQITTYFYLYSVLVRIRSQSYSHATK